MCKCACINVLLFFFFAPTYTLFAIILVQEVNGITKIKKTYQYIESVLSLKLLCKCPDFFWIRHIQQMYEHPLKNKETQVPIA